MSVILFADNDPDFLNTRAEFLQKAGYRVLKAYTLEQARQILAEARVHLAILDIRLLDDDDERDTSGLTLARDPAFRPVPKIVLTGFPTYQGVRAAMAPALDSLPPAVDFLSKKDGAGALIQAVDRAFTQHVRLNWDLHIHWDRQAHLTFLHLAHLLEPDLPDELIVHRANELEDLFRQAFYAYRQIRIDRLFWHGDWRFCLSVLAESSQGATDFRILVCGERARLEQELKRVKELVPETVRGTKLTGATETVHFGAALYALPDADAVQTLKDLFQAGKDRPLVNALNHLLKEVLATWHQRGQTLKDRDLMSLYRCWVGLQESDVHHREVEQKVEALIQEMRSLSAAEVERRDGSVVFRFPNQPALTCSDPVATVYTPLEQYDTAAICKISPGRLTVDNVLVDASQRTWLTDFIRAGQSPQWWDFVCLEAAIRFDLSQAEDWMAWLGFEECLVAPASLYENLQIRDVAAELRTSVALIEHIRRQANSEVGSDPLPYYAGLLAWTVGAMARYDPTILHTRSEQMRGAHLLLAAAMIASRLGEQITPIPLGGTLRLEDDGTVWIGERRVVTLVGHELALLRCLLEKNGQVVSRQDIVETVFEEQYVGDKYQESRINSLVRRLREKIEANPDHPRYLITLRGMGYRLQAKGRSGR